MKLTRKLFIAALVIVAASAFAQNPAKDALKSIKDYQTGAYASAQKSPNPDYAGIQQKVQSMAEEAVKGVDPNTIDPKDAYDYAQIYSMLGKNQIVCDLTHKFVASNPSATDKFSAQLLMMQSCNALGEGAMLEQTLKQTKPSDSKESGQLAMYTTNMFVDTIAKTQGDKEAIRVLDQIEKQMIPPDPKQQANDRLTGYKASLARKNAGDPSYKMPSDDELLKTLVTQAQSGQVRNEFSFVEKKAELLADEGRSKDALNLIDRFGMSHSGDKSVETPVTMAHNFIALKGNVAPTLKFDREYGDFKSLDSWKGKVVLIDTFAHWCGPCKASFPDVRKMYDDLHPKGFEMVGVTGYYGFYDKEKNLDPTAEYARMDGFMKDHNMNWPIIFDDKTNFKDYGISGIPTSILIGRDGKVIATEVGYSPETFKAFRAKVEAAVNGG